MAAVDCTGAPSASDMTGWFFMGVACCGCGLPRPPTVVAPMGSDTISGLLLAVAMIVGEDCCGFCRALATAFVIFATAMADTLVPVAFVVFLDTPLLPREPDLDDNGEGAEEGAVVAATAGEEVWSRVPAVFLAPLPLTAGFVTGCSAVPLRDVETEEGGLFDCSVVSLQSSEW